MTRRRDKKMGDASEKTRRERKRSKKKRQTKASGVVKCSQRRCLAYGLTCSCLMQCSRRGNGQKENKNIFCAGVSSHFQTVALSKAFSLKQSKGALPLLHPLVAPRVNVSCAAFLLTPLTGDLIRVQPLELEAQVLISASTRH